MIDEEFQIERIESYLNEKMPVQDRLPFEAELKSNADLHRLFLQHKYLLDGMHGMKLQAFSKQISGDTSDLPEKKNRSLVYVILLIALLGLLSILYFALRPSDSERLFKSYYSAPIAELNRSGTPETSTSYQAGMQAFSRKNWSEAIAAFDRLSSGDPLFGQGQYYKAHALIGMHQYDEAHALFTSVALQKGEYAEQAEWNSILTGLLLKRYDDVTRRVTVIVDQPTHFYHRKATQLQDQLAQINN